MHTFCKYKTITLMKLFVLTQVIICHVIISYTCTWGLLTRATQVLTEKKHLKEI